MDNTIVMLVALTAIAGLVIGWLLSLLLNKSHETKFAEIQQLLEDRFKLVAGDALKSSNENFLQLAQEKLKQFQVKAEADLSEKEKAIEQLLKPLRQALEKTEKQISTIEKERKEAYGSISSHLRSMAESQLRLQTETQNLVKALRRPEVRGQWGEITLRRLAELAGMVDHCDFFEQENVPTEDGRLRPDMIIRLPENRELIVDVKTPLDSYLSAVEADNDAERKAHLVSHARKVRERINELANKQYWSQFKQSPDFVILFIPGDQFLSAALDYEPDLIDTALKQKVMLATPTSFVALLKAVAFGWRQIALAENAEHIRELGENLYSRLATFSSQLVGLGNSPDKSVEYSNNTVGSLERNVLPGARKFTEMGVHAKKELASMEKIETLARKPDVDEK